MTGPLHGYELAFLRAGNVLIRHSKRYPLVMMWWVVASDDGG